MPSTPPPEDRQARLSRMQASHRSAERRRSFLIVGAAALVAVVLVGVVVGVIVQSEGQRSEVAAAAEGDISGVEDFGEQTREHVQTAITYEQNPPVGGDHLPVWQNCGFYSAPLENTGAGVHSMEHGAVWITYDADLPAAQVEQLQTLAADNSYLLVSPMADLPSPVVASAWGVQLQLDSVDDERLPVFLVKYLQGAQTPEPGAACSGGYAA